MSGAKRMRRIVIPAVMALVLAVGGSAAAQAVPLAGSARVTVKIFAPKGDPGLNCNRVYSLPRAVRKPRVLTGAMRALLAGPTAAERRRRYGGWFSAKTAGMLRGVRLANGTAYIDFANFSRLIPNASSSCGSALLLAQLDRTTTQFPSVRRTVYSFDGSAQTFYEWLQLSPPYNSFQ